MAAVPAATCGDPAIRALHERLLGAAKARKAALTACMRKLLTIANAIMRDALTNLLNPA